MKILLVNPPATLNERWGGSFDSVSSTQQLLGIGYIASFLEQEGKDVDVLDAPTLNMDLEMFKNKIKQISPDIVGISAMTPVISYAKRAAEIIKEVNPEIKIIFGGPHISSLPEQTLKEIPQIDFGVVGEGEITSLELINAIENNESIKQIKGLAFIEDNKFIFTGIRPLIENLDELPFPAREKFPKLSKYHSAPGNYRKKPVATMMSSRGCPFNCTYCYKGIFGRSVRLRTAKNIVDEMELLYEKFGAREIIFFDDIFTLNKKRILEICNEIKQRKLNIIWNCESHVKTIDFEMLNNMRKAGCWQVSYGIESGSQKILDSVNKEVTLNDVRTAIKITKKAKMKTRGYFILGFPGETKETIKETIDFAKELKLHNALFSLLVPFPGTKINSDIKNKGGLKNIKWDDFRMTSDKPVYIPEGLTEQELSSALRGAYKEFYMNPRFILRHLLNIRSLEDIKSALKGFFTVQKF